MCAKEAPPKLSWAVESRADFATSFYSPPPPWLVLAQVYEGRVNKGIDSLCWDALNQCRVVATQYRCTDVAVFDVNATIHTCLVTLRGEPGTNVGTGNTHVSARPGVRSTVYLSAGMEEWRS